MEGNNVSVTQDFAYMRFRSGYPSIQLFITLPGLEKKREILFFLQNTNIKNKNLKIFEFFFKVSCVYEEVDRSVSSVAVSGLTTPIGTLKNNHISSSLHSSANTPIKTLKIKRF